MILVTLLVCSCSNRDVTKPHSDQQKGSFVNSLGMRMVKIPSPDNSRKGLYVSETEVTVYAYQEFCNDSSSGAMSADEDAALQLWLERTGEKTLSNFPVVGVTWHRAQAFCDWLSKVEGKKYRLPSLEEWEYFCLAGSLFLFHFGNDESKLDTYAWYQDNSENEIHPVAEKEPNEWGLYDVYGNVWEWTEDDVPTFVLAQTDFVQDSAFIKGGAFFSNWRSCISYTRWAFCPKSESDPTTGFRVVCEMGDNE